MNPIPSGVPIAPTSPLVLNGYLQLVMLFAMAILVIDRVFLWAPADLTRWRERLRCPVRPQVADVLFRLGPDGTRIDVLRCSVLGHQPFSCGKVCLRQAAEFFDKAASGDTRLLGNGA